MYVSARVDYALRALVVLPPPSEARPLAATQLAEDLRLPLVYLRTTLKELRAAGLVIHGRGAQGGYSRARPASDITVWDVVAALRVVPVEIHPSPGGTDEVGQRMSAIWQRVESATVDVLSSVTVADLTRGPEPVIAAV